MTFTQITYFEAVCEYKNVTNAAKALYVSRSAVSRSLKELENEWNVVLFNRSRTGVEITEDGEMLRSMFKEFNKAYGNLKRYMNDTKRSLKAPELNIGITTTTGSRFFPDFFPGFKNMYPDIRIHITERPTYECMDAIINGDCDFIITPHLDAAMKQSESIETMLIYTSEMVFCVSPAHELAKSKTLSIEDIADIDRASLLTPLTIDILDEKLLSSVLNCNDDDSTNIKSSQQELIRKAVACGFTSIIIPREIAENWEDVSMIPFDPVRKIYVYIIWNKNSAASETQDKFLDYVRKYDFSKL